MNPLRSHAPIGFDRAPIQIASSVVVMIGIELDVVEFAVDAVLFLQQFGVDWYLGWYLGWTGDRKEVGMLVSVRK